MDTLGQRIERDGPLAERDAAGWIIRLCKRLQQLHRLGVAHGSISAQLILVEEVGYLSRGVLADVRQGATRPAYHSPERHAGKGISQADDTWACAVMLYQLLTGKLPFPGETKADIYLRVRTVAAAPLAVFDIGDDALQTILDQHLLPKSDRQNKITGLRKALEGWHSDAEIGVVAALEEDEHTYEEDDEEEGIQTVMRDFSAVREQIKRIQRQRDAARAGSAALSPSLAATQKGVAPPAAQVDAALREARPAASAQAATAPPQAAPATAPPQAAPTAAPPQAAPAAAPPQAAPATAPPQAAPATPQLSVPSAPQGSEPAFAAADPPEVATQEQLAPLAFDIEENESDDDVATVMMDTAGTELSKAIEEALGASANANAHENTAAPAAARQPMTAEDFDLEALAAQQPADSSTKRTIIVLAIMAVIVVVIISWLWLASSGSF